MNDLDKHQDVVIPFTGKGGYSIKVRLQLRTAVNAKREDFSEKLRNFSRKMITETVFLDNRDKLPPKTREALRKMRRSKIREMVPRLIQFIDWEKFMEEQAEDEKKNLPWGTCPECECYDPLGYGRGAACPNCGHEPYV